MEAPSLALVKYVQCIAPTKSRVQRRHAGLLARGRASAFVRSRLGRPRPDTLCVPDRCNDLLGGSAHRISPF